MESGYLVLQCFNGAHFVVTPCSAHRKLNTTAVFRGVMTVSSFASIHFRSLGVEKAALNL